jgi:hypothetical protein
MKVNAYCSLLALHATICRLLKLIGCLSPWECLCWLFMGSAREDFENNFMVTKHDLPCPDFSMLSFLSLMNHHQSQLLQT